MKINQENRQIFEKVNIHDCEFVNLVFQYESNSITIELRHPESENYDSVTFYGVLGFEMRTAAPWGKSHRSDCIFIEENRKGYKLKENLEEESRVYNFSKFSVVSAPLSVYIALISGDMLNIICEYIEIDIEEFI